MNITQRLYLTFSLLSSSLVLFVIIGLTILTGFQSRIQYVQTNAIPSIIDLSKLVDKSNELIVLMYRHQGSMNINVQTGLEEEINKSMNDIKSLSQYYLEHDISSDEDKKMTEAAFAMTAEFEHKLPQFLRYSRVQDDVTSLALLQDKGGAGEAIRNLLTGYKQQLQLNVDISNQLQKINNRIYQSTFWGMIIASAAIIFVLSILAIKIINNIRRSVNNMRTTMEDASLRLDLTLRVDDSRNDEIGMMAKAFNHLVANVADSLLSVSVSSSSVSTASAQISAGNEDLSSRTEEQAASLEQTAASMTELSETVRQTAENTRVASQLSHDVMQISDSSTTKVQAMLGTMSDIKNSSAKITDIIALIEGIAFQTNILALNAAVEAARAGEQGRGFAVVAGEVRNLAQRSSASAREIKDLIESSIRFVEVGAGQAEDVSQNMGRMNDSIRQVTDLVNEIAAASQEQTQGIGQVHQAINQMDDATQQNASLVEEASAASRSLMDQATVLNELVAAFVLNKRNNGSSLHHNVLAAPAAAVTSQTDVKKAESDDNWQHF